MPCHLWVRVWVRVRVRVGVPDQVDDHQVLSAVLLASAQGVARSGVRVRGRAACCGALDGLRLDHAAWREPQVRLGSNPNPNPNPNPKPNTNPNRKSSLHMLS